MSSEFKVLFFIFFFFKKNVDLFSFFYLNAKTVFEEKFNGSYKMKDCNVNGTQLKRYRDGSSRFGLRNAPRPHLEPENP